MDEPVEDGVGEGRFADVVMPDHDRALAGDERGLAATAVVEDLERIASGIVLRVTSPKPSIKIDPSWRRRAGASGSDRRPWRWSDPQWPRVVDGSEQLHEAPTSALDFSRGFATRTGRIATL